MLGHTIYMTIQRVTFLTHRVRDKQMMKVFGIYCSGFAMVSAHI